MSENSPGTKECILYTETNSSVSEYGTPSCPAPDPGIPLMASLVFDIRPTILLSFSPANPHQFAFMAIFKAGWARIAGVHSTVCILAIKAQFASRALSKI